MSDVLIFSLNDGKRKTVNQTVVLTAPSHHTFFDKNDSEKEVFEVSVFVNGLVTPKTAQTAEVELEIKADVLLRCDYCLTSVGLAIDTDVEETIDVEGDTIDIIPLVEEAVILALPMSVSCSEDCLGLCHQCGANLNESKCSCEGTITNPQFVGLL